MNSDFWTSRLAAAKRQFHHQHHHLHAVSHLDDFDVEEEVRTDIPCPYCYEDFDIGSLCTHLEDEHSSESNPAVCPICYVKVSRDDVLDHITLQHGHLSKLHRRCRLQRVGIPSNSPALPLLGRDLREAHLQILLGSGGGGGGSGFRSNNTGLGLSATPLSDPFLSSLVLNLPMAEVDDISKSLTSTTEDVSVNNTIRAHSWKPSYDSCLSSEERERLIKQASGRAGFVQDLLFCTFLED